MKENQALGVIRRSKNKPYASAKDPESTLVDIKKLLMRFGIDPNKILTRIDYTNGRIQLIFEVKIPKSTGNVPMVLRFNPQARTKRARVSGHMERVYDLSSAARQLYHKIYNKLVDVSNGYSTEVEEFLAYITIANTNGATLLDRISSTVESGELSLGSIHEALALPAPTGHTEQSGPVAPSGPIIDAEIVSQ